MPFKRAMVTDFARKLSAHDLYDLSTAMRGPDDETDKLVHLKTHITNRLRAILFGPRPEGAQSGPLWNDLQMSEKNFKGVAEILLFLRDGAHSIEWIHFVQHLWHAVNVTAKHEIWGGFGQQLIDAFKDTVRNRR